MLFRVFWTDAPRWLYVPIYIALGWAAIFFIPAFFHGATALGLGIGIAVFVLIFAGGALYTVGGVVYGFRRPNPWPRWFGFHEVFHSFTILAFVVPLRRGLDGDVRAALIEPPAVRMGAGELKRRDAHAASATRDRPPRGHGGRRSRER